MSIGAMLQELLAKRAIEEAAAAERERMRSPDGVRALLDAGATVGEITALSGLEPHELRRHIMLRAADSLSVERKIQLERVEEVLESIWPSVQARKPNAIQQALALMKREAELLGLDAPKRSEVDSVVTTRKEPDFTAYTTEQLDAFVEAHKPREIDVTPKQLGNGANGHA